MLYCFVVLLYTYSHWGHRVQDEEYIISEHRPDLPSVPLVLLHQRVPGNCQGFTTPFLLINIHYNKEVYSKKIPAAREFTNLEFLL